MYGGLRHANPTYNFLFQNMEPFFYTLLASHLISLESIRNYPGREQENLLNTLPASPSVELFYLLIRDTRSVSRTTCVQITGFVEAIFIPLPGLVGFITFKMGYYGRKKKPTAFFGSPPTNYPTFQ